MGTELSDLLATYRIVKILEDSKIISEQVTDDLPGIFAIIDGNGLVMRGNRGLAQLLDDYHERLHSRGFFEIFQPATWENFKLWFAQLGPDQDHVSFELKVDAKKMVQPYYLWDIKMINTPDRKDKIGDDYVVLGRDITELRLNENKLSAIYSGLGQGLLVVGSDGRIESVLSEQAIFLIGKDKLVGRHLSAVLFQPIWATLEDTEKRGVAHLFEALGKDLKNFNYIQSQFPRSIQIAVPTEPGGRHVNIDYRPLMRAGKVDKMLVTLDGAEIMQLSLRE